MCATVASRVGRRLGMTHASVLQSFDEVLDPVCYTQQKALAQQTCTFCFSLAI